MPHILVVHHDADLYGADKSLVHALRALRREGYQPIVALPRDGPLLELLQRDGLEVHVGPVGKLSRTLMRGLGPLRLPAELWRSVRFLDRAVAGRRVAAVYSNSISALGGAAWGLLRRVPRLCHVREIVTAPRAAAAGFPWLLDATATRCVCNSHATRDWLVAARPSLADKARVVWNGIEAVEAPALAQSAAWRATIGLGPEHVIAVLVGRINRWKGHNVFLDAALRIDVRRHPMLRFVIVGDVADGQHHFREQMLARIRQQGLEDRVRWLPFTADVDTVWAACDIAVVPSTEPEPFGRVAIEAMAHGLPVVAAAHGGLVEIVEGGQTGELVPPGDAGALAAALEALAASPALRLRQGREGLRRQQRHFSQSAHDTALLKIIGEMVHGGAPPSAMAPGNVPRDASAG